MLRWSHVLGTPLEFARRMAFATGAGVFLGLIGPFGSYDAPPLERTAGWVISLWAGALILGAAMRLAGVWSARSDVPRAFARSIAVMVGAAPLAAISAACFHVLVGVPISRIHWLIWYSQVLAISFPVALGYLFIASLGRPDAQTAAGGTATPSAPVEAAIPAPQPASGTVERLLARLPVRLGRDIVALQMEDHYVRVHTTLGSDLLLMPMAQAVEALAAVEGMRVHRSWWVARAAVEGQVLDGRNLRLRMRGGLEAPVARTSVAQVRTAGWLRGEATAKTASPPVQGLSDDAERSAAS